MKTFEIFTDKHSQIVQAESVYKAILAWMKLEGNELKTNSEIIAIVNVDHPIAKELKIK